MSQNVIKKIFDLAFNRAGVKYVFADNDGNLQSKASVEAWKKFGIVLWPGAGQVTNSAVGGFPVNRSACNPLDQSIHASWKTHEGGLYDVWNSRALSRKTPGGFLKDFTATFTGLPMRSATNVSCHRRKKEHFEGIGKGKGSAHRI